MKTDYKSDLDNCKMLQNYITRGEINGIDVPFSQTKL